FHKMSVPGNLANVESGSALSNQALLAQLPGPNLLPATEAQTGMSELAIFFEQSLNLNPEAAAIKAASVWAKAKVEASVGQASAASSERGVGEAASYIKDPFLHQRKIAGTIEKLGKTNFVSWLMSFLNLIEGVPLARKHLEGIEHDADFFADGARSANYDHHLDIELGRVLIQTLNQDARSVVLQAHNEEERRASVLYDILKTELLRSDPAMQDYVHDTVYTLKQNQYDAQTLVQTFRYWFTYSALIGSPISPSEQVRNLLRSLHPRHHAFKTAARLARGKKTRSSRLSNSKNQEQSDYDFETLASKLILEEFEMKTPASPEHAFAVAMAATGHPGVIPPTPQRTFPLPGSGSLLDPPSARPIRQISAVADKEQREVEEERTLDNEVLALLANVRDVEHLATTPRSVV
ncbi:hypothetical protein A4X13_0g9258, partial [Tilletia indica]